MAVWRAKFKAYKFPPIIQKDFITTVEIVAPSNDMQVS